MTLIQTLKVLGIQVLKGYISFEIIVGEKVYNFLRLYRSPSQIGDAFETFADDLESTLDALINSNLFLIIAIGGFNAKTGNC